ncbi:chemotaxis signal transduction protein [Beggiatoa alba B18LD]|uniref:Chemotaxis signal transduction protein n=1 Tax=Beggiatoa alba B18LD TaxID=395493 RepID=I3CJK6_9GAMM|nr:chemotaxis protein CheW [Beggiatoa alba]EIJ43799.1 chemotaxis signal transduction protein [Beggiatoa alba B18LD]
MKTTWLSPSEALNRPLTRQAETSQVATGQLEIIRRLGFHVGNIGLLIAQNATSELIEVNSICPIPNTASWLLGLINLRGNLVPVFDLNLLLGLENRISKKNMLLILGRGEAAGAIILDKLPQHVIFMNSDRLDSLPPLPAVLKPFATQGYEKSGEVWFNFDHQGFFESLAGKVAA